MGPRIRAQVVLAVLAAALAGCATAPAPMPPARTGGLSCGPLERKVEFPKRAESPDAWDPEPCGRGFVSLRFVVVGEHVYAIGVSIHDGPREEPLKPFVVGPMPDLPSDMSKGDAVQMGRKKGDWHTFYQKLYRAYGHSRPLALVCPDRDCPITPESPPPGLLGMTASYGSGSFAALEPIPIDRAYAARADVDGGRVATDAVQVQTGPQAPTQIPKQEPVSQALITDTVARAVCAAKILTVPDLTSK